jgi:hypothetical protein
MRSITAPKNLDDEGEAELNHGDGKRLKFKGVTSSSSNLFQMHPSSAGKTETI